MTEDGENTCRGGRRPPWEGIEVGNFTAIDFETANHQPDSACAVGLVKVENGKIRKKKAFLIRPPYEEFVFTYVHGLTWEHVKDAPDFGRLWPKLLPYFEGSSFFAAHNSSFDRGVLRALVSRYELPFDGLPFVCSMQVARKTWKLFPTKLSDVARFLSIPLNHHEALSDAMACAKILIEAGKVQPTDE